MFIGLRRFCGHGDTPTHDQSLDFGVGMQSGPSSDCTGHQGFGHGLPSALFVVFTVILPEASHFLTGPAHGIGAVFDHFAGWSHSLGPPGHTHLLFDPFEMGPEFVEIKVFEFVAFGPSFKGFDFGSVVQRRIDFGTAADASTLQIGHIGLAKGAVEPTVSILFGPFLRWNKTVQSRCRNAPLLRPSARRDRPRRATMQWLRHLDLSR